MILKIAAPWISGLAVVVLLDLIWIGGIASNFYRNQTGHLLHIVDGRMVVNIPAALATWALIVTGIHLFVLPRAAQGGLPGFLFWGALFGAITYGIYDLTNYALLRNWPLTVTVVDILWGAVLCGLTAVCMALASRGVERFL
jgi:uncharacterized membrane protein